MVDDSKAFKPVGANRDPTPLVLAFHSSRGDSSTIPIPVSLLFYIRPFPSLAPYLSKAFARPLDNGDRHLATSGGSIALHDLHENLLWNFHEIAWRGEGRERLTVPLGWSLTVLHRVVYLSRLPSGIVTLADF